jgi:hypothetical protein
MPGSRFMMSPTTCILTIVIEKPIQFTMVSAVPLEVSGAAYATRVEKSGESATTDIPQMKRNTMKTAG